MNELRNSKSDDQLEELLLLTEQMQEELARERPGNYQGTESAARRIADLEREVKQREQNTEHSSLKELT